VGSVVNAASYATGPVSAGEMVVLFGSSMGPAALATFQLDQGGRLANALSGVQASFGGALTPLIYVSASQIAAMVPFSVAGAQSVAVQVNYAGQVSDPFQVSVAAATPGVFSADASGKGAGAISNSDGSPNTPTNPASPGSYITLYLTGVGQTDPPGSDGGIATAIANVSSPVSVQIAGQAAQLLYAGAAPGNVNGFAQINAVIPAGLAYGGNLPVVIQIGAAASGPTLLCTTQSLFTNYVPLYDPPASSTLIAAIRSLLYGIQ
jgi:uncharacterized protein (TIGR03437 family)